MPNFTKLTLGELTSEQRHQLRQLAHSRAIAARTVERARILLAVTSRQENAVIHRIDRHKPVEYVRTSQESLTS